MRYAHARVGLTIKLLWCHKVQRADLTCDVIRKVAPFVLSKLWILVADWSLHRSHDTFLIKLRLYEFDLSGKGWTRASPLLPLKQTKRNINFHLRRSRHCQIPHSWLHCSLRKMIIPTFLLKRISSVPKYDHSLSFWSKTLLRGVFCDKNREKKEIDFRWEFL